MDGLLSQQEIFYDASSKRTKVVDSVIQEGQVKHLISTLWTYHPSGQEKSCTEAVGMPEQKITLGFLKKIEKAYSNKDKIHLFSDNARYYKNKTVTAYLKTSKIELHFLPPYSPNLNPIERLGKWMCERIMYNTYYEYFEDFKSAVMGFLESVSNLGPDCLLG